MADPDKIPETQTDTCATYDPTAEDSTSGNEAMESSGVPESQDFHLIDCEETQERTKPIVDKVADNCMEISSDFVKVDSAQKEENTEVKLRSDETSDVEKKMDTELPITENRDDDVEHVIIEKKDDVESINIENKEDVEHPKAQKKVDKMSDDDDEDDFVQSSQLEALSPLKKQISNLMVGISQKRRADNTDDALTKFPRTCSREDALSDVRKRLDDEIHEITETVKDGNNEEVISHMIIEETQESCEKVEVSESLQQVEQELEETLSQHLVEEEGVNVSDIEKSEKSIRDQDSVAIERVIEEKKSSEREIINEANTETDKSILHDSKEPEPKEPVLIEQSVDSTVKEAENKTNEPKIPAQRALTDDTKETTSNDAVEVLTIPRSDENSSIPKTADSRTIEKSLVAPTSASRSRMSIEVIYDRATAASERKPPRELVEIDEDGEKIVLDSSQESHDKTIETITDINKNPDTSYKTCASTDYKSVDSSKDSSNDCKSGYSMTNGSTETKIDNSDLTTTTRSELFASDSTHDKKILSMALLSPSKKSRFTAGKVVENPEIVSISSSEESFVSDERSKNKEQTPTNVNREIIANKTTTIEKELSIIVKLKCLVCVDDITKEHLEKIVTGVHCESTNNDFSTSRHRNSDNSANLADISGNEKDTSPGSVTSIPHPYPLNPRLSLASVASSSSISSAGSLNAKLAGIKFQLPRGPAKHAKKLISDSTSAEKNDELLEQIKKEWKNVDTVTSAIMTVASNELNNMDLHNGSTLRVDNSLVRIRSSTPEVPVKDEKMLELGTPKRAAKRGRAPKGTRAKNLRSSESNGVTKSSPVVNIEKVTPGTSKKRKSSPDTSTPSRQSTNAKDTPTNETNDELIGKDVFAKWSDNKYYPGTVTGKTKTKFKVNFYDGQNKMIIEDFIVTMPTTLSPGLSVYATSDEDDYGSCGIILEVKKSRDSVTYIVETDERERIEVDIRNIFLTNDQIQVLKEETKIEMKSPPSTPKHLGKVTLDNVIDGKRRSKRVLTPVTTTPKGKRGRGSVADKIADASKASSSGVSSTVKFDHAYETTSESNFELDDDDYGMIGVQEEIIGTPNEQDTKGPLSGLKGKARSRKKPDTPEIIANLGPIPPQNSDIFRGMSFILSCASLDTIERYQARESSKDTKDSNSDPGTENEEEWSRKPFVRDRLIAQLIAGGGKIYENFQSIPPEEYERTKHITNVPNTTKKSLLCLSVGIKPYNHQWVIRSCQQNRIVNPSEEELPAGWSLLKKSYIEMFERRNEKPFQTLPVIVVIPVTSANKEFVSFWRQICENAGGAVLLVERPDDGFIEGTVVLTNKQCPAWVIEKASSWNIPLVSTLWVIECLIEGNICSDDVHPSFKYNSVKRSSSHISHLTRR